MSLLLPPHLTSLVPQTTDDPGTITAARTWRPPLCTGGQFSSVSGTAYWVYLGMVLKTSVPKHVEFYVRIVGAGAQTAEAALAYTDGPPDKSNQTLSKIVATGTLDSLTSLGVKRNTSAFATTVYAGTHLWAGLRVAMATTQPGLLGLQHDWAEGYLLTTASSAALTGAGPWTGSIITPSANAETPDLRVTLD